MCVCVCVGVCGVCVCVWVSGLRRKVVVFEFGYYPCKSVHLVGFQDQAMYLRGASLKMGMRSPGGSLRPPFLNLSVP